MSFKTILIPLFVLCLNPFFNGGPEINESKLIEHIRVLSSDAFEGRLTGEEGNAKGRRYIINELQALGISAFNESYEQAFSFKRNDQTYEANNVLGWIKGTKFPDKYIVITAHHDHVGTHNGAIYNGADDNASGVAALLSFAEYLSKHQPEHSVIFAALDAEEMGLKGAEHFVATTAKSIEVVLNINMDMIGRSTQHELYVVGSRHHKTLTEVVAGFKNPTDSKLLVGHDGSDGKDDWTYSSDHAPFHAAGIPFLYFGNEDHKDYHQPGDDFDKITQDFFIDATTMILALFQEIDTRGL